LHSAGVVLKGVDVDAELASSEILRHLKRGSVERLRDASMFPPGIVIGSRLVEDTGITLDSQVYVMSPQGELAGPLGGRPSPRRFRVVGVFESGFYQVDSLWAFTNLQVAQRFLSTGDTVNKIEINVDDLNRVDEYAKGIQNAVGGRYTTITWKEQNK